MNVYDFFSSPIGLGHVTRDIAIVDNFKDISVNFVTGSGAAKILKKLDHKVQDVYNPCLLYTSPSPRDRTRSRMPSSA